MERCISVLCPPSTPALLKLWFIRPVCLSFLLFPLPRQEANAYLFLFSVLSYTADGTAHTLCTYLMAYTLVARGLVAHSLVVHTLHGVCSCGACSLWTLPFISVQLFPARDRLAAGSSSTRTVFSSGACGHRHRAPGTVLRSVACGCVVHGCAGVSWWWNPRGKIAGWKIDTCLVSSGQTASTVWGHPELSPDMWEKP